MMAKGLSLPLVLKLGEQFLSLLQQSPAAPLVLSFL